MTEPHESGRLRGFKDYKIRLGDEMRGLRATMGKSFMDIERELHIRAHLVDAIEKADLDRIDAKWIIPGHVRTYAKYLGMNPENAYQRFCEESGFVALPGAVQDDWHQTNIQSTNSFFSRLQQSLWSSGRFKRSFVSTARSDQRFLQTFSSSILILGLIAGIGYVLWTVYDEILAARQTVFLVPEQGSTAAGVDTASAQLITESGNPEATISKNLPLGEQRIGDLKPNDFSIYSTENIDLAQGVDAVRRPQVSLINKVTEVKNLAQKSQVVIVPSRTVWVQVTTEEGDVIKEGSLVAGSEYKVPQSLGELRLRAGNSGYLYFVISGDLYGPAGQGTSVVQDLSLAASSLKTQLGPIVDEIPQELIEVGWNVFVQEQDLPDF